MTGTFLPSPFLALQAQKNWSGMIIDLGISASPLIAEATPALSRVSMMPIDPVLRGETKEFLGSGLE